MHQRDRRVRPRSRHPRGSSKELRQNHRRLREELPESSTLPARAGAGLYRGRAPSERNQATANAYSDSVKQILELRAKRERELALQGATIQGKAGQAYPRRSGKAEEAFRAGGVAKPEDGPWVYLLYSTILAPKVRLIS